MTSGARSGTSVQPGDLPDACTAKDDIADPCGGEGRAGATIETDLGWALGTVFRAYRRAAGAVLSAVPGGPRGYQVLATAVRDGARPQAVLAAHLGVDRTVMTYLLDDLEKAGVLVRQPDPDDRRVRRVAATRLGRTRLAELEDRLREAEVQVLSRLGPGDADVFRTLLQRLACSARDHPDGASFPTGDAGACAGARRTRASDIG